MRGVSPMKYRKKTVYKAFRITRQSRWKFKDWPEWLRPLWFENSTEPEVGVPTLDGYKVAFLGDWIVLDNGGDYSVWNDAIFKSVFEVVKQ